MLRVLEMKCKLKLFLHCTSSMTELCLENRRARQTAEAVHKETEKLLQQPHQSHQLSCRS